MVRNAAHDSICACSVDEVVDAVLRALRRGPAHRRRAGRPGARARWPDRWPSPGPTVVNAVRAAPAGHGRGRGRGREVPGAARRCPSEPGAFGIPRGMGPLTLDAATVRTILGMLPNGQPDRHHDAWIQGVTSKRTRPGSTSPSPSGAEERLGVPIASMKQDLYTRLGARPDSVVRIKTRPAADPSGAGPGATRSRASAGKLLAGRRAHPVPSRGGRRRARGVRGHRQRTGDRGRRPHATARSRSTAHAGFGRLVDGGRPRRLLQLLPARRRHASSTRPSRCR